MTMRQYLCFRSILKKRSGTPFSGADSIYQILQGITSPSLYITCWDVSALLDASFTEPHLLLLTRSLYGRSSIMWEYLDLWGITIMGVMVRFSGGLLCLSSKGRIGRGLPQQVLSFSYGGLLLLLVLALTCGGLCQRLPAFQWLSSLYHSQLGTRCLHNRGGCLLLHGVVRHCAGTLCQWKLGAMLGVVLKTYLDVWLILCVWRLRSMLVYFVIATILNEVVPTGEVTGQ